MRRCPRFSEGQVRRLFDLIYVGEEISREVGQVIGGSLEEPTLGKTCEGEECRVYMPRGSLGNFHTHPARPNLMLQPSEKDYEGMRGRVLCVGGTTSLERERTEHGWHRFPVEGWMLGEGSRRVVRCLTRNEDSDSFRESVRAFDERNALFREMREAGRLPQDSYEAETRRTVKFFQDYGAWNWECIYGEEGPLSEGPFYRED